MICIWLFVKVRAWRGLKCGQGVWEFPLVPEFWKTPCSRHQQGDPSGFPALLKAGKKKISLCSRAGPAPQGGDTW